MCSLFALEFVWSLEMNKQFIPHFLDIWLLSMLMWFKFDDICKSDSSSLSNGAATTKIFRKKNQIVYPNALNLHKSVYIAFGSYVLPNVYFNAWSIAEEFGRFFYEKIRYISMFEGFQLNASHFTPSNH